MNMEKISRRFVFYAVVLVSTCTFVSTLQTLAIILERRSPQTDLFMLFRIISTFLFFFLPIIMAVGCSYAYFARSDGSLPKRFFRSLGLTSLMIPLSYLIWLPLNFYEGAQNPDYWQYDTYAVQFLLIPFYIAFIFFCCICLNGGSAIRRLIQSKRKAAS